MGQALFLFDGTIQGGEMGVYEWEGIDCFQGSVAMGRCCLPPLENILI